MSRCIAASAGWVVAKHIGSLGFDSRAGQIGPSIAAARFLSSTALNYGGKPRPPLHASTEYRKYNEDFDFFSPCSCVEQLQ